MSLADLSIVVLTCRQRQFTLRCLDCLRGCGAEIILVDNASGDGTAEAVAASFPDVVVIRNDRNLGVAAGRNLGLRRATRPYLMLLDNDTEPTPGAIRYLLDRLKADPSIGLIAPRLTDAAGEVQLSFKPYPGLAAKMANVVGHKKTVEIPSAPIEPFYVIGAAQLFARSTYEATGGLDEKIFYGPEDADFCMAVRGLGLRVVYDPRVSIIHHWQRATTRRLLSPLGRRHIAALLHFWWKHKRL